MNNDLKLYYFDPNTYGAFAFTVIANSKEEAMKYAKDKKIEYNILPFSFDKYEITVFDLSKGVKSITYTGD